MKDQRRLVAPSRAPVAALGAAVPLVVPIVPVVPPAVVPVVVPLPVAPLVALGTLPGNAGVDPIAEGTWLESDGTLGTDRPLDPTGGVTTVVTPVPDVVPVVVELATPRSPRVPPIPPRSRERVPADGVVDGVVVAGEEVVPPIERGRIVVSGAIQFTSRCVQ